MLLRSLLPDAGTDKGIVGCTGVAKLLVLAYYMPSQGMVVHAGHMRLICGTAYPGAREVTEPQLQASLAPPGSPAVGAINAAALNLHCEPPKEATSGR